MENLLASVRCELIEVWLMGGRLFGMRVLSVCVGDVG